MLDLLLLPFRFVFAIDQAFCFLIRHCWVPILVICVGWGLLHFVFAAFANPMFAGAFVGVMIASALFR